MKWLDRLLRRLPPDPPSLLDPILMNRSFTDAERAYLSEKLAAVEKTTELLARVQRLGYDLDSITRRDTNE